MRGRWAGTIAALACAAALLPSTVAVAAPSSDAPAGSNTSTTTTATGRYVAQTPTRVLDTRSKIGIATTTPLHGGQTVTLDLSKAVSTEATSVALSLAVVGPTQTGFVTTFATGTPRPNTSSLNWAPAATTRNLAIVALGAGRKVNLYIGTSGTTHLQADLTGYFRSEAPGQGGFGTAVSRTLSTRDGVGVPSAGPLAGRGSIDFTVIRGTAGIPADASAVVLNLTVGTPSASGYAITYPTGGVRPLGASIFFNKGLSTSAFVVVPIGDHGQVHLFNGSSGSAQFYADVQGYLAGSDPTTLGAIGSLPSRRLLDTRNSAPLGAGTTTTVSTFGRGGVPRARVAQVVLSVTANDEKASGHLTIYSGTRPAYGSVNYDAGRQTSGTVIVTPDASGRVTISTSATTQVLVDVVGYVLGNDLGVPPTTTSRYVSSLASISGTGSTSEGCVDGAANPSFVLLDIGAQTVTPDSGAGTSATNPGVSLAQQPVNTTTRVTYPHLVTALNGYLEQLASCKTSASPTRVALGTNNDGVFSPSAANYYSPTQRGIDWADDVVDAVSAPAGISVLGANDIEAGFASTETQAENWINAYLASTPANLVYNGSLDNCPDAYASTSECGPAAGKTEVWTRADYVRLTYGLRPGRITVLPQIYLSVPNQAGQWSNVYQTSGEKLIFEGSLTQYGVCNSVNCGFTGAQGWSALYHALSTVVASPSLPIATDLQLH